MIVCISKQARNCGVAAYVSFWYNPCASNATAWCMSPASGFVVWPSPPNPYLSRLRKEYSYACQQDSNHDHQSDSAKTPETKMG